MDVSQRQHVQELEEELRMWRSLSQDLYLEYIRLKEKTAVAPVYVTGESIEMKYRVLRSNFLYTFFSCKFVLKQLVKLILHRVGLRAAPDVSPFFQHDCTPQAPRPVNKGRLVALRMAQPSQAAGS
ncbi:MAG: hypothetical protein AB7K24_01345 [Gemmataceae bacterium]